MSKKEKLMMCSNCHGNPWLVKMIPGRGLTAYPCPFCNTKKPYRLAMEIHAEEMRRMTENVANEKKEGA